MCIVIDINTLASVFDSATSDHGEFRPVLSWINDGCGIIIYGGTTYKNELRRSPKYLRVMVEQHRAGKTLQIDTSLVDKEERRLIRLLNKVGFDDPHIIAMIIVSRCRLLCTKDRRSHQYVLDNALYTGDSECPAIYSGRRNISLLSQKYVADICKKTEKGKKLRKAITSQ